MATTSVYVPLSERRALTESKGVTLDGKPAVISGYRREYATVTMKGSGLSAEWAWPTIKRIVSKGGAFKS